MICSKYNIYYEREIEAMRKAYYINLLMLILCTVLFMLLIRNVNGLDIRIFKDGLVSHTSYVLLIFIAYSWMILESSYIKNNSIISVRKGIILFNEISDFELKNLDKVRCLILAGETVSKNI